MFPPPGCANHTLLIWLSLLCSPMEDQVPWPCLPAWDGCTPNSLLPVNPDGSGGRGVFPDVVILPPTTKASFLLVVYAQAEPKCGNSPKFGHGQTIGATAGRQWSLLGLEPWAVKDMLSRSPQPRAWPGRPGCLGSGFKPRLAVRDNPGSAGSQLFPGCYPRQESCEEWPGQCAPST